MSLAARARSGEKALELASGMLLDAAAELEGVAPKLRRVADRITDRGAEWKQLAEAVEAAPPSVCVPGHPPEKVDRLIAAADSAFAWLYRHGSPESEQVAEAVRDALVELGHDPEEERR
jgi:hypothetical protein